ncbi:MAG TPA: tetratricopeptide repeat protein [Parafilimonas sp.]|nr:tetratricopeptide repeat protein [Parafilimonas sp.]
MKTQKADSSKVNVLNEMANQLRYADTDSAISISNEALTLAMKLNFEIGIADSKTSISGLFADKGTYYEGARFGNEAIILYKKLLSLAGASHRKIILEKLGNAYMEVGHNNIGQGNLDEGSKYTFLSLKVREEVGDKKGIADAEWNIGYINLNQDNFSEALKHYFISLKLYQQLARKADIASAYNVIGLVYFYQGNYQNGLKSCLTALHLAKEVKDDYIFASIYDNLGVIYKKQENYGEALKYHFAALKIYEKTGNNELIPYTYNNIGLSYMKQKRYNDASEYLGKALSFSKKIGSLEYMRMSYLNWSELDSSQGNYKKALEHYKSSITCRDSLTNENSEKKIIQLQMQYEFDKKEDQIKLLSTQNKLQTALAQQQSQRKNFAYAGIGVILLAGGYGFYRFRRRRKLQSEQEMLNERLRISRELHDDMGSTLGSISIYSEVAKNRSAKNENADEVILKIGAASRELIDKMSDIVWSINPNNESLEQLQNRMQAFAAMILTPHNIQYSFLTDESIKKLKLTAEERKNIFLIFKEAIHNIVKYADCKEVEIKLSLQDDQLEMIIKDDGKGFDTSPQPSPPVERENGLGGNGIKNMKARAESMHADFKISSEINKGTSIEFSVNLN